MPVKEYFKDWEKINYGEWSQYAFTLCLGDKYLDIMLYHEPLENEDYAGTYTIQAFIGDEVVFCYTVNMED